jgi:hypothetical protein
MLMFHPIWDKLTNTSRSVYLLASLIVLIFVYPTVAGRPIANIFLGTLFAITPLAGVYAVSINRRTTVVATILGAPAIMAIIGHFFFDTELITDQVFLVLIVIYYSFTTVQIIRHIFTKRKVDADTIISAVSAYLMIGLSFAVTFMLVHLSTQVALVESTSDQLVQWEDIFYFSFVTLTTLGYGDITPVTPVARSLAMLEAVCGVMYMSILIARLVSEYQSSRNREE